MQRHEEHFNTPVEVESWLGAAVDIVERLELDDDLKVPAFVKAVELLSAKQVFFNQPQAVQLDPRMLRPR